jgi:carbonic anhydrase
MNKILKFIFFFSFIFTNLEVIGLEPCSQQLYENGRKSAWHSLQIGNREFVRSPKYARQRKPLIKGQNPHIIVLSCSDSRAPPELLFSQGLGKLFVLRVAGQVVDDVVLDSIEFAVTHFDVSLIVVLGHTDCGAVKGALDRLKRNHGMIDTQQGHFNAVLIPIEKAILAAGIDLYAPNALQLSIFNRSLA